MPQLETKGFPETAGKVHLFEIGEVIHVHRLAAFRHIFANGIGKKLEGELRQSLN